MRKIVRLFAISLLIASIVTTALASSVSAHDQDRDRDCDPVGPAYRYNEGPH